MAGGRFKDLIVYRRATAFADCIQEEVVRWDSFNKWSVGLQLVRSADSVGANIAEGTGRRGADQRRFLLIARSSLHETEHWLLRAEARGLLDDTLRAEIDEISRAITGLLRGWQ